MMSQTMELPPDLAGPKHLKFSYHLSKACVSYQATQSIQQFLVIIIYDYNTIINSKQIRYFQMSRLFCSYWTALCQNLGQMFMIVCLSECEFLMIPDGNIE